MSALGTPRLLEAFRRLSVCAPRGGGAGGSGRRTYVFSTVFCFSFSRKILRLMAAWQPAPLSPLLPSPSQPNTKPQANSRQPNPIQTNFAPTQSHPRQLHANLKHPLTTLSLCAVSLVFDMAVLEFAPSWRVRCHHSVSAVCKKSHGRFALRSDLVLLVFLERRASLVVCDCVLSMSIPLVPSRHHQCVFFVHNFITVWFFRFILKVSGVRQVGGSGAKLSLLYFATTTEVGKVLPTSSVHVQNSNSTGTHVLRSAPRRGM